MAHLSKSQLGSLFLVLLLVLEKVHIATGTSSKALVFKKEKEQSLCGQVIKKANVVSDIICALTCSREPTCVGFNLGIGCDACPKSCQITRSLGLCQTDADFDFYTLQRPREKNTIDAATTPMLPTTTALATIPDGEETSTSVTTIGAANNPTTTTALAIVPTPTTTRKTTTTKKPTTTTTTRKTTTTKKPTTTTTAAPLPSQYDRISCSNIWSLGKAVVGLRMYVGATSLESMYVTAASLNLLGTYTREYGTKCNSGDVASHLECSKHRVRCLGLSWTKLGTKVSTVEATKKSPSSNYKSAWCPTGMVANGVKKIYVDGKFSTFAVNCIEIK